MPIKFNGALFTVDATVDGAKNECRLSGLGKQLLVSKHPASLLAAGDERRLGPAGPLVQDVSSMLFRLATDKTRLYYHHAGANFQETMFFWGTANNPDFGWGNPGIEAANGYVRWNWAGGLELTAMMLDQYDITQDRRFARETLLPLADAITTFYDQHWPRDAQGKIRMEPAQSMETWQQAVNPLPEIAGLRFVLPRLIALPEELTTPSPAQRCGAKRWPILPPIPIGHAPDLKTTSACFCPPTQYCQAEQRREHRRIRDFSVPAVRRGKARFGFGDRHVSKPGGFTAAHAGPGTRSSRPVSG